MKRLAFIALIFAAIGLPIVALGLMNRLQPKPKTIAEELRAIPKMVNPTLPQAIDQATELVEVETTDTSITYKYRIVTAGISDIDTYQFMNALTPEIKQRACATPELTEKFLSKGVSLHYVYHDRDMTEFGFVDVVPSDCGY